MTKNSELNDLDYLGVRNAGAIFWNLSSVQLYEHAVRNCEGELSNAGPLVVLTGQHTGRSARDKFIICNENTEDEV